MQDLYVLDLSLKLNLNNLYVKPTVPIVFKKIKRNLV